MENNKLKESKEQALHYMQTLVDVARESFLILDVDLRVVSANPTFYENFQVAQSETENTLLYDLGNGQWNIPELRRLLEEILPTTTTTTTTRGRIVKNYEVSHVFEKIGQKTMVLNARQIDSVQLIILAIEDITPRKDLEDKLAKNAKGLAVQVEEKTRELGDRVAELESLNKTMIGRELKMVELKKENEELKKKI